MVNQGGDGEEAEGGKGVHRDLLRQRHVSGIGVPRPVGLLHNHKPRVGQVSDQPLRRDPPHRFVRVMDPFSTTKAKRERQRLSDFIHCGWAKFGFIGHARSLSARANIRVDPWRDRSPVQG
jgi:hypothetical protein